MGEAIGPALAIGASAFVIALTGAMAPGPLLTVTIAHTVRRGGWSAMLLLVGHALLEAVLLVGLAF
jgi:threonine/homoserine/homoserine lactone efflux protein